MARIRRGFRLARQSWSVISGERSLVIFPILSAIAILVALVAIWAPTALLGAFAGAESIDESNPLVIAAVVVSAYVATFLTIFFNVALVSAAGRAFAGEPTSVGVGIAAARERTGQIAGWALLATTVGLVLRAIEERVPFAGQVAVWIAGAAWAIATYLVVPVLAYERVGPVDALKRSASIVRRHWGESLTGNIGIGLITGLVAFAVIVVGGALAFLVAGSMAAALAVGAVTVLGVALVAVIGTALTQVFNLAVYRYASDGEASTGPFSRDDLEHAFRPKKGEPQAGSI